MEGGLGELGAVHGIKVIVAFIPFGADGGIILLYIASIVSSDASLVEDSVVGIPN